MARLQSRCPLDFIARVAALMPKLRVNLDKMSLDQPAMAFDRVRLKRDKLGSNPSSRSNRGSPRTHAPQLPI
jgi:hypothetical protein